MLLVLYVAVTITLSLAIDTYSHLLIPRAVGGAAMVAAVLPYAISKRFSGRIGTVMTSVVLSLIHSIMCAAGGGDHSYFLFQIGLVGFCLVHLDLKTLAMYIGFSNIIVFTFVVILGFPMLGEGYGFRDYAGNIIAFVFLSLVFVSVGIRLVAKSEKYHEGSLTCDMIMAKIPTFLAITNDKGEVSHMSAAMIESLGLEDESQILGRPLPDLFKFQELKDAVRQLSPEDGYVEKNFHVPMDDEMSWLMMRSSLVGKHTAARFFEWVDITPLVEARNLAEAADKAKSDFLAKMSHEIRTPMNAIMGMSELILRKDISRDLYEKAIGIKSASVNLLSIINDVLDFSKLESGGYEIMEGEYELSALINDVANIMRMRLTEKPVLFTTNIDSRLPGVLWGDEVRIRQILLNLLANAVKYTQEGHISLDITGEAEGNSVLLTAVIEDTGIGIREEDLGKLFQDFVQLDVNRNRDIEGTGLGLVITRSLCVAMGGDITVKSTYGKGSAFTMTLPQKIKEHKPFAEVINPTKVLFYETRRVYRESVVRSFEDLGVEYKCADNISQLIENLSKYPHIFTPSFVYERIAPIIKNIENPPNLTLLTDITETMAAQDARMLIMPAHTLTISNVLNNIQDGISYVMEADFTAPEAKILIVDDVKANLEVMEGLLSPYEMQVTLCQHGPDAVGLISTTQFDMVFMDHMMPEMDGIEATKLIRANTGEYYEKLPIIALTANAAAGGRERFIDEGMNDYLAKPIETVKLGAILDRWIPRAKRRKPAEVRHSASAEGMAAALTDIPELSVDKALLMVNGSKETYERIVKVAVRLLPENIEEINNTLATDLKLYAVGIHGIKGVLNNIGAYGLGEIAYKLEILANDGEGEACAELHRSFAGALTHFVERVMAVFNNADTHKRRADGTGALSASMSALEMACEFFDSALALETLDPLIKTDFGGDINRMVADMVSAFERFDFDNAGRLIDDLKGTLSA